MNGVYGTPGQDQYLKTVKKKREGEIAAQEALKLPGYKENRDRIAGHLNAPGRGPYVGPNPYEGGWQRLIGQLEGQANGTGPSLAQAQYQRAAQDQQAAIGSLARSSARPGAARAAMMQQAKVGQGLASGSAEAMLQEQTQARAMLGSALGSAGSAAWQRDGANQQAWMALLGEQLGLDAQQFQALLQREQFKMQQANQPTGFERLMGLAGQGAQLYAATQTGGIGG